MLCAAVCRFSAAELPDFEFARGTVAVCASGGLGLDEYCGRGGCGVDG